LECETQNRLNNSKTKIIWPPTEILIKMVSESSYKAVGKLLGVADNTVKKRIKKRSV